MISPTKAPNYRDSSVVTSKSAVDALIDISISHLFFPCSSIGTAHHTTAHRSEACHDELPSAFSDRSLLFSLVLTSRALVRRVRQRSLINRRCKGRKSHVLLSRWTDRGVRRGFRQRVARRKRISLFLQAIPDRAARKE